MPVTAGKAELKSQSGRTTKQHRQVADLFKQASDPTRLQILLLLVERPRNGTEMRDKLDIQSQSALSHHVAFLRHSRLIEPHRQSRNIFYSLTDAGRRLAETAEAFLVEE